MPVNQTYYTSIQTNGSRSPEEVKHNQNVVVAIHPPFSHANLRSDQNLVEMKTPEGNTKYNTEHDGLERLKVPVFCAAIATFIFGVILFVRKALHMDIKSEAYYQDNGQESQDNENVLVNGDDVMYIYDEHDPEYSDSCGVHVGYESTEFRCAEIPLELTEEDTEHGHCGV
ncbi:uncharacterized protein LOC129585099 isoform X2 [Paramacrobiotus metropolitanus]|nr:uncharacterized protein LOC129585099 isoform X2 [Paramacrobiotus metropolitanus]